MVLVMLLFVFFILSNVISYPILLDSFITVSLLLVFLSLFLFSLLVPNDNSHISKIGVFHRSHQGENHIIALFILLLLLFTHGYMGKVLEFTGQVHEGVVPLIAVVFVLLLGVLTDFVSLVETPRVLDGFVFIHSSHTLRPVLLMAVQDRPKVQEDSPVNSLLELSDLGEIGRHLTSALCLEFQSLLGARVIGVTERLEDFDVESFLEVWLDSVLESLHVVGKVCGLEEVVLQLA